MAIFNIGVCLTGCHQSHHEGKLTKKYLKRLRKQREDSMKDKAQQEEKAKETYQRLQSQDNLNNNGI